MVWMSEYKFCCRLKTLIYVIELVLLGLIYFLFLTHRSSSSFALKCTTFHAETQWGLEVFTKNASINISQVYSSPSKGIRDDSGAPSSVRQGRVRAVRDERGPSVRGRQRTHFADHDERRAHGHRAGEGHRADRVQARLYRSAPPSFPHGRSERACQGHDAPQGFQQAARRR